MKKGLTNKEAIPVILGFIVFTALFSPEQTWSMTAALCVGYVLVRLWERKHPPGKGPQSQSSIWD